MFIAMNRFKVIKEERKAFEDLWVARQSHLDEVKGFRAFHLLRGPEREDHVLYSSHTIWASQEDFTAWTKSEQFRAAHQHAGERKPLTLGHPEDMWEQNSAEHSKLRESIWNAAENVCVVKYFMNAFTAEHRTDKKELQSKNLQRSNKGCGITNTATVPSESPNTSPPGSDDSSIISPQKSEIRTPDGSSVAHQLGANTPEAIRSYGAAYLDQA